MNGTMKRALISGPIVPVAESPGSHWWRREDATEGTALSANELMRMIAQLDTYPDDRTPNERRTPVSTAQQITDVTGRFSRGAIKHKRHR